ncbi:Secretory pathway protein Sec39 [Ceratobasidium sp. AG-Ba]|nr:Secretory pathway protein Sec39 [Ceratobasidium sp. AG-Ba]
MDESYQRWIDLTDDELTPEIVRETLLPLEDDVWVAAACADRILNDVGTQSALLELGLLRTGQAGEKIQNAMEEVGDKSEDDSGEEDSEEDGQEEGKEQGATQTEADPLKRALIEDETSRRLLALRLVLLRRLDLTRTYGELIASGALLPQTASKPGENDEDDPWAEEEEKEPPVSDEAPFMSLPDFLATDIVYTALLFASTLRFAALKQLFVRHLDDLFPYRLLILENIPPHVPPVEYVHLLPSCNYSSMKEETRLSQPWRDTPDWVEQPNVQAALAETGVQDFPQFGSFGIGATERPTTGVRHELLSADELASWFKHRVEAIDELGLVDVALEFVQHAAALAIPSLDAEGEELSLLARLVYDVPVPETKLGDDDWTLDKWRSMNPDSVIRAYLKYSTPATVAADIRRLVTPYLFVLDARRQREQPSPTELAQTQSDELLYGWLLNAPLELAAAVFIASKADLPVAQRVVQKDEDLARLALACLYGSDALDAWPTMSSIFECLPAWEISDSDADGPDADEADTTLASLAAFVTPTTARPTTAPTDLYAFFRPLPARALSRALDVLDVHLESGEVLARWGVPAPLRWFVQSAKDASLQRAWATRMARRSGGEGGEMLLDDMVKLSGGSLGDLRGAFGMLKRDEVVKIFFEGLLSAGRFEQAHTMLNPRGVAPPLSSDAVESLCLAVSREFYDNASSGNIHSGDMKLAYDWWVPTLAITNPTNPSHSLGVPLQTPAVIKEREFIEATSRICAFNVVSRPGIPITPLEIRLVKDRLSLIARVLSSTDDAYKHTQVILDLVAKLGFRGDSAAEVKALAMIADSALSAEDFEAAAETSTRMVKTTVKLRAVGTGTSAEAAAAAEAIEVCWHTCFQLGRQTEFTDIKTKMTLLAHALELCPPENVGDVLNAWKRLEGEKIEARKAQGPAIKKPPVRRNRGAHDLLALPDMSAPLISPDAAAAAARTFSRVAGAAANLPFAVRGRLGSTTSRGLDDETSSTRSRSPESVASSARHAFSRGVGWLIGANE